LATISPFLLKMMALELVVPWSRAKIYFFAIKIPLSMSVRPCIAGAFSPKKAERQMHDHLPFYFT